MKSRRRSLYIILTLHCGLTSEHFLKHRLFGKLLFSLSLFVQWAIYPAHPQRSVCCVYHNIESDAMLIAANETTIG